MLKAPRHHPVMVGTVEVLVDAARYVAIVLVMVLLIGQMARLVTSWIYRIRLPDRTYRRRNSSARALCR